MTIAIEVTVDGIPRATVVAELGQTLGLRLAQHEPAPPHPKSQICHCGTGKAFADCHGAEVALPAQEAPCPCGSGMPLGDCFPTHAAEDPPPVVPSTPEAPRLDVRVEPTRPKLGGLRARLTAAWVALLKTT